MSRGLQTLQALPSFLAPPCNPLEFQIFSRWNIPLYRHSRFCFINEMWADIQPCIYLFDVVDLDAALSTLNHAETGAIHFDAIAKFVLATPWTATLRWLRKTISSQSRAPRLGSKGSGTVPPVLPDDDRYATSVRIGP